MAVPTVLPTEARGETFGGVTYHIDGELVPVLQLELGSVPAYFRAPRPSMEGSAR